MKKFYWALIALVSFSLNACDKFHDDVDFDDLIGTWGITSYYIEGRPVGIPSDTRVSFYDDYTFVAIANNEDANGDMGNFSFNPRANDLTFAGNTCNVEELNETTLRINYRNNFRQYCEMTYKRVYPPSLTPIERQMVGLWEQHFTTPSDFWHPNASKGDFYLYLYPNGDFIDLGTYSEAQGPVISYSKFGHYTLSNRGLNVYFGKTMVEIPIVSSTHNSLTLLFTEGPVTYYKTR